MSGSLGAHCIYYLGYAFPLVEAREDQAFLEAGLAAGVLYLFALLQHEAVEDVQPIVLLQYPLPKVTHRVAAVLARRVTGGAIVAPVERQEEGRIPGQLGGHADVAVAHGEMHHCAATEAQQWLLAAAFALRPTIHAVLLHGSLDGLREVRLQFDCRNRNAIDEERQVDLVGFV
ncbi:hypothetical protein D3C76_1341880 [compost metagenome]